jgi:methyl-accepting chemotaxis protein
MIPLSMTDMQILIAAAVFLLGCLSMIVGVLVLISRGHTREMQTLAAHTARLAQKGLTDEIGGLVRSASELVTSLNQLVRTATGSGSFLITLGLALITASYWVIQQIEWAVA